MLREKLQYKAAILNIGRFGPEKERRCAQIYSEDCYNKLAELDENQNNKAIFHTDGNKGL